MAQLQRQKTWKIFSEREMEKGIRLTRSSSRFCSRRLKGIFPCPANLVNNSNAQGSIWRSAAGLGYTDAAYIRYRLPSILTMFRAQIFFFGPESFGFQ
jgi:hypothetical protein